MGARRMYKCSGHSPVETIVGSQTHYASGAVTIASHETHLA